MATSDQTNRATDADEQGESNTWCPECGESIRTTGCEMVCDGCELVLEARDVDA